MFGGFGGLPRKKLDSLDKPCDVGLIKKPLTGQNSQGSAKDSPNEVSVFWKGIVSGLTGYAKANREIVKRLSARMKVWLANNDEDAALLFLEQAKKDKIDVKAPQVTFLPPQREIGNRYRVIYTMMETPIVHPHMIQVMNENYQECWTPTRWNASTFMNSGLKIPIHVMPLGVDPDIYTPNGEARIPMALRLTGRNAGHQETPSGFLFVYVCQPTFRKGLEVLGEAFDEAFSNDPEAGLIIATTAHSASDCDGEPSIRSRIWLLRGSYSESELAAVYRACKVYVCTSRGEGLNLPLIEAAAVGIPVVVPRTSVHPEMVPEGLGFFFDSDHSRVFPDADKVSPWFDGMSFPDYGKDSHRQLVNLLKRVKKDYAATAATGKRYMQFVRSNYTWDLAAQKIAARIKELCQ